MGLFVGLLVGLFVEVLVEALEVGADDEVVVGFGSATPVDWGMLAAPAGTSTMLLVVEFKLDCAIPMRLLVRSKTTYADLRKKSPSK